MAVVLSSWAEQPPTLDGSLASPDWDGAGTIPIPAGYLLVKNDAKFLYVALDMVGDTGKDAGTGDYFWFTVDVDGNTSITPNKDIQYGLYPSPPFPPNKIGLQKYLGPGAWTGLLNDPTTSQAINGFAATPRSATPHRIWEMRLALDEFGAELTPGMDPPVVRFGVRVASTSPAFAYDYPTNFYNDFSNLHEILLTTRPVFPAGTEGAVLGGVGLIPAGKINSQGYATTDSSYYVHVTDSAFAGRMNILGNRTTLTALWGLGARRYRIMHRVGAGPFVPLDQTWTNYRWTGTDFVLESFGPDANHRYPLLNPAAHYSINDLLLQWGSVGFPNNLYELQAEFFTDGGVPVAAPAQTLRLRLDNTAPLVDIVDIIHDGASIPACGIVTMTGPADGVQVKVTAWEPEGHLGSYSVYAAYGDGQSAGIASVSYSVPPPPSHLWNGVQNSVVPAGEFVPPVSCAYQFGVWAWLRATNGYVNMMGPYADTRHVTLIKPGVAPASKAGVLDTLPLGMKAADQPAEGVEPELLGIETIPTEG